MADHTSHSAEMDGTFMIGLAWWQDSRCKQADNIWMCHPAHKADFLPKVVQVLHNE
jgi:hypothetical protein